MNNLKSIINDIESLQGRLRSLYRESEIIKREFIALEKLREISVSEESQSLKNESIPVSEIMKFIESHGPVSLSDMKEYFNCDTRALTSLSYLKRTNKIKHAGMNDKGLMLHEVVKKEELSTTS